MLNLDRFSVQRKGFLILLIGLLFQIAIAAMFYRVIEESQNETLNEIHARNMQKQMTLLTANTQVMASTAQNYFLTADPLSKHNCHVLIDQSKDAWSNVLSEFQTNAEQSAGEGKKRIDSCGRSFNSLVGLVEKAMSVYEEGDKQAANALVAPEKVKPIVTELVAALNQAEKSKAMNLQGNPREWDEKKNRLGLLSLAVIATSMILSAGIGSFVMNRGITRRLHVVTANSLRFASNQPLAKPLSGTDEIAVLDNQFHRMAETIERTTQKERAVFANMPVGLMTLNSFGVVESVNPCAERLLEISEATVQDSPPSVLTFFSDPGKTTEIFSQPDVLDADRGPWRLTMKRSDGSTFPAELAIAPYDDSGAGKLVLSVLDVSAREELEKMRQEFVSVVSHDIRTPLTSIQACLTMLSDGALGTFSEKTTRYINLATVESGRLLRLTTDLLDIAKLESGNMTLDCSNVSVGEMIVVAANAVDAVAGQKGVNIVVEPTSLTVYADEDRTVQILVNFLSNAIKFTPEDKTITVNAAMDGDRVVIRVIDEGCGIPEDTLAEVFERFKQARLGDRRTGTGLGLAICKMLSQCQNGSVGVESQEGVGSTFWLRLPLGT